MPAEFGRDCAGFYTTVPPDLYSPWEMQSLGDLPWAMHDYWMLMRRGMDEQRSSPAAASQKDSALPDRPSGGQENQRRAEANSRPENDQAGFERRSMNFGSS
jgi:hypothetical protein